MSDHHDRELDELHHEPWEGFPRAFWIMFVIGVAYLIYIFIEGFGKTH